MVAWMVQVSIKTCLGMDGEKRVSFYFGYALYQSNTLCFTRNWGIPFPTYSYAISIYFMKISCLGKARIDEQENKQEFDRFFDDHQHRRINPRSLTS